MNNTGNDMVRVDTPSYPGERYEAEVPDTLDLAERAALAINALTRVVDPEGGYELYFVAEFAEDPPKLYREWCGIFNTGKFLEALPLMRMMSGSDFNLDVDVGIMESYLRDAGSDGLYYAPVKDRPWAFYIEQGTEQVPFTRDVFGFIFGEGRLIMAMCVWYQHDHDPRWKRLIEKKIDRLLELGYKRDGAIRFTRYFVPGQVTTEKPAFELDGWLPYGAITYYQLTGYKPALELARAQVNFLRTWFEKDGRWRQGHFHLTCAALIDMLEYAIAVGDKQLIELVKNGYEYGKAVGEPLVGFFPEDAGKGFPTCESCAVADMIFLAIRLTEIGAGDYWEDVDRYVRNQFVENQMTRTDWADPQQIMARQTDEARKRIAGQIAMAKKMPGIADERDVMERCLGAWSGWGPANDWVGSERAGIMQCCTGNASTFLYYAWNAIVTPDGDGARVNLLLNRASPWLDVDSYLPYEGKVVMKNKTAKKISVRIPEWTGRAQIACDVNGHNREFTWSGNYIGVDNLKRGDVVTVRFPMVEIAVFHVIGNVYYKLTIKGNTVVDMDPPGQSYPLYQRDHYKADKAPMKKTTRFVSKDRIVRRALEQ
ncbi:MAG: glycoside hydrolase family 127 protein [Verrucomicrobia bacterium]|nr:glycoside hydrolase family 127 protein [Verrucomicrobiota bacterium]